MEKRFHVADAGDGGRRKNRGGTNEKKTIEGVERDEKRAKRASAGKGTLRYF